MFDNPFLTDLRKSLELEKETMDSISKKIYLFILEGKSDFVDYIEALEKSVVRYREIEELIKKEEERR